MEEKIIIKTSLSEKDTKDIYELAKSKYMKTVEMLCSYIDGMSIIDLKNKDGNDLYKAQGEGNAMAKMLLLIKQIEKEKESVDN
jgi:hypothetical protein